MKCIQGVIRASVMKVIYLHGRMTPSFLKKMKVSFFEEKKGLYDQHQNVMLLRVSETDQKAAAQKIFVDIVE